MYYRSHSSSNVAPQILATSREVPYGGCGGSRSRCSGRGCAPATFRGVKKSKPKAKGGKGPTRKEPPVEKQYTENPKEPADEEEDEEKPKDPKRELEELVKNEDKTLTPKQYLKKLLEKLISFAKTHKTKIIMAVLACAIFCLYYNFKGSMPILTTMGEYMDSNFPDFMQKLKDFQAIVGRAGERIATVPSEIYTFMSKQILPAVMESFNTATKPFRTVIEYIFRQIQSVFESEYLNRAFKTHFEAKPWKGSDWMDWENRPFKWKGPITPIS